jgi:hypothetical protein
LFQDPYEYGLDEQIYLLARHTGLTLTEILSLTRSERIKMFERLLKDLNNEHDYKRAILESIARLGGA